MILARQSESVKTQQPTIRGDLPQESSIEAIKGTKSQSKQKGRSSQGNPPFQRTKKLCERCGKQGPHNQTQCPAKDVVCHGCGKIGHFKSVCRSTSTKSAVRTAKTEDNFLGTVYTQAKYQMLKQTSGQRH